MCSITQQRPDEVLNVQHRLTNKIGSASLESLPPVSFLHFYVLSHDGKKRPYSWGRHAVQERPELAIRVTNALITRTRKCTIAGGNN
jgi:hypothetical protein